MTELAWDNNLINLRDLLADLYWDKAESVRVVQEAGLKPRFFTFKDSPLNNWFFILDRARQDADSVNAIIDVAIREAEPAKQGVLRLAKERALTLRGADITKDVQWQRPLDSGELEKITGSQSTLMPITFLELGLERSKAVARIDLGARGSGSGFLIGEDLLLTNHHVLKVPAHALAAKAQFNYQHTAEELAATYVEYALDPDSLFCTSAEDDWTVTRVKAREGAPPGQQWGWLTLSEQDPQKDDFTIIIQHPSGGPKQIALYHNVIAFVDDNKRVIQYLTDTEPGSSGSPVFDTRWNVIALHHSGGWLREPGGDPKQKFYRNEGIHINTVIKGLKGAGVM